MSDPEPRIEKCRGGRSSPGPWKASEFRYQAPLLPLRPLTRFVAEFAQPKPTGLGRGGRYKRKRPGRELYPGRRAGGKGRRRGEARGVVVGGEGEGEGEARRGGRGKGRTT
jgi:hypothetical protein